LGGGTVPLVVGKAGRRACRKRTQGKEGRRNGRFSRGGEKLKSETCPDLAKRRTGGF